MKYFLSSSSKKKLSLFSDISEAAYAMSNV